MKPAHEWMLEIIQAAEELGYQIRYVGPMKIGLTTPDAGHFVDIDISGTLRQRRGSASAVGTSERGNDVTDILERTASGRALGDKASALWWQPNPLAGANAMQSATTEVRAAVLAIEDESWNAALAAVEEAVGAWRAAVTANNGSPQKWPGGSSEPSSMPFLDYYRAIASLRKPVVR